MIEVCGLHVCYSEVHALKGINLSIAPSSFVLIGGPSGGGKSSLAHAMMGLIPQNTPAKIEGHISINGLDPQRHSVAQIATRAGIVFQNPATQLVNGTVEEEVAFGPHNLTLAPEEIAARVQYALGATGCSHLQHRSVRYLSSGEQQRVAIAAALSMRPSVLILDEPTANLDIEGARLLVRTLACLRSEFQVTIIVIEHRLSPFLPCADRLIWLVDGAIVADGAPAETLVRVQPCTPPLSPPPVPTDEPLVALRRVTAGYARHPILQDCSLTLHRGDFAALVGPNGSGKTTLARVLASLLRPSRGQVTWHTNGKRPRVGLLQHNPLHQLVCDTVVEEVYFGPQNLRMETNQDTEAVLAQMDLVSLTHRLTQALSVGQQQRTALAATLTPRPTLLILDEPTIGQDWQHLTQMMNFLSKLNRKGQAVLLITHDRRLMERYANRVWVIEEGKTREVRA